MNIENENPRPWIKTILIGFSILVLLTVVIFVPWGIATKGKFWNSSKYNQEPTPTLTPTPEPTLAPTLKPTLAPTPEPTLAPTMAPTLAPTMAPTMAPVPSCVVNGVDICSNITLTNRGSNNPLGVVNGSNVELSSSGINETTNWIFEHVDTVAEGPVYNIKNISTNYKLYVNSTDLVFASSSGYQENDAIDRFIPVMVDDNHFVLLAKGNPNCTSGLCSEVNTVNFYLTSVLELGGDIRISDGGNTDDHTKQWSVQSS